MIALLLWLAAGQAASVQEGRPAPSRPGITWSDSDALERKLAVIVKRPKAARPETIVVSEQELNSYLNLALGPRMPQGLSDVDIRIDSGRLEAHAVVDLDQVKGRMPPTGTFNPITYLGGRVPIELRGKLPNSDGFATLDLDDVRLGGYSIPMSFVQQLVLSATRNAENPEGFDVRSPFRLPYGVKRLRVQTGRILLDL